VRHGAKYYVEDCDSSPDGGYFCNSVERTVSFGHSATYLAGIAAAMVLLGAVVFRRRDIT
jgi:ABC-2 type transport system permease protein